MSLVARMQPENAAAPDEVLATVAHELRQPLSQIESIAYYLSLVLPQGDERVQGQLDRIRALVEQSNWILTSGVQLACDNKPVPEPARVETLLMNAVSATASTTHFAFEFDDPLPEVHLDRQQGPVLFDSLLMVFRPLGTSLAPVAVRARPESNGVLVELSAAGSQPESFAPGSSVALECARKIAEGHGGWLAHETAALGDAATGIRVRVMLP